MNYHMKSDDLFIINNYFQFASAQLPVRCKRHPRCLCKRSDVSVKSANVQLI